MRILVLSGGALNGAWQAGVLSVLSREGDWDVIVGSSVGAIAAAYVSQADPGAISDHADSYEAWWWNSDSDDWFRKRFLAPITGILFRFPAHRRSLYDNSRVVDRLRKEVSVDRIIASGRFVRVGAVQLESGKYVSFEPHDPQFIDAVVASTSHVAVFPSVVIRGRHYEDANARSSVPMDDVLDVAAAYPDPLDITVINCSSRRTTEKKYDEVNCFVDRLFRSIEVRNVEINENDVDLAVRKLADTYPEREITVRVYRPGHPPVPDPLKSDREGLRRAVRLGRQDARLDPAMTVRLPTGRS